MFEEVESCHTSEIGCRSSNERPSQISDGVHSINDASGRSPLTHRKAEIIIILRVGINSTHQRTIVAVDARIEECYKQTPVKLKDSQHRFWDSEATQAHQEHVFGEYAGLLNIRRLTERRIVDHFGGIFTSMLLLVWSRAITGINNIIWCTHGK